MKPKADIPAAADLFHRGVLALAKVEQNGVRVDEEYLDRMIESTRDEVHKCRVALEKDDLWRVWRKRYGQNSNLQSVDQLATVLFVDMKVPFTEVTATGKPKADEGVLAKVDMPFVKDYLRMKKFSKVRSTYLTNLRRETIDGFFHPNFNLHLAQSYRSSSGSDKESESEAKDFNFQNIPVRNPETGPLVRRCFIPREDARYFVEIDFSGIEVRVSACYNNDPTLMHYIKNSSADMHGDTAMELFFLTKEQVKEMKKTCRDWSKNRFVFPQFYGSVWFQCAPHLWEAVVGVNPEVPGTGLKLVQHMAKKGVKELGDCSPDGDKNPKKGTFARVVKDVEDSFWQKRFPVYTRWKKSWYKQYLENGYFDLFTGFRCEGVYRRNQVINYPVQGSAFHCLLWSLIELNDLLTKYKMKSKIVGQIHDSIVLDCHPKELQTVLTAAHEIMTDRLPKAWKWINVPLETESEVSPAGRNWADKRQWVETGGVWAWKG